MSPPQGNSFDYSPGHISAVESDLSIERLQPYVTQAGGDKQRALRLYERNTKLSEALYGPLQGVEVVIRNAFHIQLLKQFGPQWFDVLETKSIVVKEQLRKLQVAREYLRSSSKSETAGRVVSELSFGFWVGICAKRYHTTLWTACLHRPFKGAGVKGAALVRAEVFDRLENIRVLRNRVAHHEPILSRDLEEDYKQILETIAWISGASAKWIDSTSCFRERFAAPLPPSTPPPTPALALASPATAETVAAPPIKSFSLPLGSE